MSAVKWLPVVLMFFGYCVQSVNFLAFPIEINLDALPIKIGGLFQLTPLFTLNFLDPIAFFTTQQVIGAYCAIQAYPPGMFVPDFRDISNTVTRISSETIDLLKQPVAGIIGPNDLATTQISASATTPNRTPQFELLLESFVSSNYIQSGSFFDMVPVVKVEAAAIIKTLQYFNWSLFTAIFDITLYGLAGLAQINSQAAAVGIQTTCSTTIDNSSTLKDTLGTISSCLANSDSKVVLLWMSYDLAQTTLSALYENSKLRNSLTFIASDRWAYVFDAERLSIGSQKGHFYPVNSSFPESFLHGTLAFRPYSVPPQQLIDCLRSISPSTTIPGLPHESVVAQWEVYFLCSLSDNSLPPCPSELKDRTYPCACSGQEILNSSYLSSTMGYAYDAALVLMSAVVKLKNPTQCAALGPDYASICARMPNITTADISQVVQTTNMTEGTATGNISFVNGFRVESKFQIFQYHSSGNAVPVGTYSSPQDTLQINDEMLSWKTDGTPVSAITPSSSSLTNESGAYVLLTLLGITIAVTIALGIYFFYHRESPVVKKASYVFLQLIMLGIVLSSISAILSLLEDSVTSCILEAMFAAMGFSLIIGYK